VFCSGEAPEVDKQLLEAVTSFVCKLNAKLLSSLKISKGKKKIMECSN
jgi:hypothetical protein